MVRWQAVRHHNFGLTRTGGHTDKVTFQYFPGLPGNGTMKEDERAVFHGRLFADADGVKAYIEKLCKVPPPGRMGHPHRSSVAGKPADLQQQSAVPAPIGHCLE